jgi:hypothetical protein
MHKNGFGQAYYQDTLKRILNKFTLYFSKLYSTFMDFRILNGFLEILIMKKILDKGKTMHSIGLKADRGPALLA